MATDLHPARLTSQPTAPGRYEAFVVSQLRQAHRRIRLLDVAAAGAGFLILSLAYGLAMALVDRALNLPSAARQAAFALYSIGACLYLVVTLIRPLFRGINPYYAARRLEQTLPEAKNSVVNWLDLHDESIPTAFRSAISQRAAKDLAHADLEQAISGRRASWLGGGAFLLFFVLLVLFVLGPQQFLSLMHRAFAPFVETSIATRTRLTLVRPDGGDATVTVGQAVSFSVLVDGRIPDPGRPDAVRLLYRYNPADVSETRLFERNESTGEWITSLAAPEVRTGFWYKVAGGDTETDEYHVQVRSTPLLSSFDITYRYRPYLGWADRTTQDPNLKALRGTEVTIIARANRGVKEGQLAVTDERSVAAELLPSDPQAMRFHLVIDKDAVYRIWFTSTDGEKNSEPMPYTIQALHDQPPQVELKKPHHATLPANGVLHAEGAASDDFGVASMVLRMKRANGVALQSKPYRPEKSFRRENGSFPQMLDYKDFVELEKLKQDKGGAALKEPLQPGDEIEYWLEAKDSCDYPAPNVGESKHFKITIGATNQDKHKQQQQRSQAQQDKQQHDQMQDEKLEQNQQEQQNKDQQSQNQQAEKQEEKQQNKSEQQQKSGQGERSKSGEQSKPNNAGGKKGEQQQQTQPNNSGDSSEDQKLEQQRDKLQQAVQKQQQNQSQQQQKSDQKQQAGDPQNGAGNSQDPKADNQQNQSNNPEKQGNPEKQPSKDQTNPKSNEKNGNAQNSDGTQPGNPQPQDQPKGEQKQKQSGSAGGADKGKEEQSGAKPKEKQENKQPEMTGDKKPQDQQGPSGSQQPAKGANDKAGKNEAGSAGAQPQTGTKQPQNPEQKASQKPQPNKQDTPERGTKPKPSAGAEKDGQKNANQKPTDASPGKNGKANETTPQDKGSSTGHDKPPSGDNQRGQKSGESASPAKQQPKEKSGTGGADQKQEASAGDRKSQDQANPGKNGADKGEQRPMETNSNPTQKGDKSSQPMPDSSPTGQGAGSEQSKPKATDAAEPNKKNSKGEGDKNASKQSSDNDGNMQKKSGEKGDQSKGSSNDSANDKETAKKAHDDLAKALGSSDPKTRQDAQRKLQEMMQKSRDPAERKAAAEALKKSEKESGENGGEQSGKKEPGKPNTEPSGKPNDRQEHQDGRSQQGKPGGKDTGKAEANEQSPDKSSQEKGKPGDKSGDTTADGNAPPKNQQGPHRPDGSKKERGTGGGTTGGEKPVPSNDRSTGPVDPNKDRSTDPPAEPATPADAAARRRAAELQLDDLRKRVNKDVLKEAKMSEDEYRQFLKAYDAMLKRKTQLPAEKEKIADPLRGDRRGRPNVGVRKVESVGPQKAGDAQRFGKIGPPPEFAEPYQEFSRQLSELEQAPNKK
jgi:hypothetical protein